MVYNGYYKVMSNIPKMGQLPTPAVLHLFPVFHGHTLGVYNGIHHLQTNTRVKLQISWDVEFHERDRTRNMFGMSPPSQRTIRLVLPSGKLRVCYWKLRFIVDLPIKNSDFP